jgi:hypothetical protein
LGLYVSAEHQENDMGLLSRWLSFERPMGDVLVQLLYYLALVLIIVRCLERIYLGCLTIIGAFGDGRGFGDGLWLIVGSPLLAILAICLLRIVAEVVRAVFRMDRSLREVVTGRAPLGATLIRQPSPDQSPD